MHLSKSRQKGASLLEMILVVGIIALIIVGVLSYFRTLTEASNVRIETQGLKNLARDIETLYASQADYIGLNNSVIKPSGILPARMVNGTVGNNIGTSWDRVVGVVVNRTIPPIIPVGTVGFQITYNSMSDDSCADFASGVYQEFDVVNINGNNIANVPDIVNECMRDATAMGLPGNIITFTKIRDR